jgi:hypothetical protein
MFSPRQVDGGDFFARVLTAPPILAIHLSKRALLADWRSANQPRTNLLSGTDHSMTEVGIINNHRLSPGAARQRDAGRTLTATVEEKNLDLGLECAPYRRADRGLKLSTIYWSTP